MGSEADAFAKVAAATTTPDTVKALLDYCETEALALIRGNLGIVNALIRALVVSGTLFGDEVDTVISREVAVKALAEECARRAAWKIVENNAAGFVAYGSKGC